MIFGRSALAALVGSLIFALPASAVGQPTTVRVEDLKPGGEVERQANGFVHRASGYLFPGKLGEVPARKTTTYGPGDADVYYTLYGGGNGDGWFNIFVYPAEISLADEVANVTQSLLEKTSGQRVAPPNELGKATAGVEEGWFRGSVDGMEIITGYRVARVGAWFIKLRASIPTEGDDSAIQRIGAAISAIDFAPGHLATPIPARSKEPAT